MTRKRLLGAEAILEAITSGTRVELVLLARDSRDGALAALRTRAIAEGIPLWEGGEGDLRRMSPDSDCPQDALALLGSTPTASLEELLARGGVTWLLYRAAYPSNVGFTIRTAEVSGADGVVVDASDFNREQRSRASHVSMGADRVMPVLWRDSDEVLEAARRAGQRIIALENTGDRAPYDVDLTGPLLLIVGNERTGIATAVLDVCDAVVQIPMAGFVPSYSLQAAVSAVAVERLRQVAMAKRRK